MSFVPPEETPLVEGSTSSAHPERTDGGVWEHPIIWVSLVVFGALLDASFFLFRIFGFRFDRRATTPERRPPDCAARTGRLLTAGPHGFLPDHRARVGKRLRRQDSATTPLRRARGAGRPAWPWPPPGSVPSPEGSLREPARMPRSKRPRPRRAAGPGTSALSTVAIVIAPAALEIVFKGQIQSRIEAMVTAAW
ncbi:MULTISPECIES: hypothetical protein [unclassified Streptomyces]|uniref:hypothetical protein n=1 Tax=unclassified Streptomyces TaxID=2593676 RepID=UPI0038249B7D